ncbi:MAG TPA: HAMP domain-containing sensor histidine kinase, partial [Gemmatimonadaceae bacterium]|nr:HAMP domain-containing sensor histidine kinase [Gemmatimonadaceae bacterium]
SDIAHFMYFDPKCNCHHPRVGPAPETLFAFSMHADTLAFAVNTHPLPSEGWEIDRPLAIPVPTGAFLGYSPGDRQHVVNAVRDRARGFLDRDHGYTFFLTDLSIGKRVLVYASMATGWGDTIIYGAQYRPESMGRVLSSIMMENDLLPASFTKRAENAIDIAVNDGDGRLVFMSNKTPITSDLAASTRLGPRFADLTVTAAIDPREVGSLIVGGLPGSRLPFLLGALMLAGALTVTAVTLLRRESELGRVRADWIASVSHELRTPLAQIRLFLDTLRLGRANTEERRNWSLAQIDRETTRLSHMIEKVLSFSRLGRGSEPDAQACDMVREADTIVSEFRTIAETRNVTIATEFTSIPPVRLRRDALRHILLNLLDNAVKYGPAGQTVRVRIEPVGTSVTLSVADEGPGVPLSERDSLWRPFARGKTSAEQGGSGIGLSIVHDLAVQHGGRATVGAAPGGGALFVVTLPAERAA